MLGVAVTGASGFLGRSLVTALVGRQFAVRALVRSTEGGSGVAVGEIGSDTDWRSALENIDIVIHTAARVHVMVETLDDPLAYFRQVNVEGTRRLAKQAALAGVRRLVLVSSIKVNGENTSLEKPFTAEDKPAPVGPYSLSKYEAEEALKQVAAKADMEVVIIRPPLVYGPGVKANFLSMMRWLQKGVPLPLGSVRNQRSLVALDNLIDLIITCIDHSAAANQTFLVSDGEDLSTTEILLRMGAALGKPARLLPVPAVLLKTGAALICRSEMVQRLLGSLQVDISKTRDILGWTPPVTVNEGLRKTAEAFMRADLGA